MRKTFAELVCMGAFLEKAFTEVNYAMAVRQGDAEQIEKTGIALDQATDQLNIILDAESWGLNILQKGKTR